jgi:hypothetical protein
MTIIVFPSASLPTQGLRSAVRQNKRCGGTRLRDGRPRFSAGHLSLRTGSAFTLHFHLQFGMRNGKTERNEDVQRTIGADGQIRAGHSVRNVAKIVGKGISTVQRVKAALAA